MIGTSSRARTRSGAASATDEPVIAVEMVRFACALAVMGLHYGIGFWHAPGLVPQIVLAGLRWRAPDQGLFAFGWLGVELFFVVSGMMIARSASGSDAGTFLRRRAVRLLPAGWLCASVTLAVVTIAVGCDGDLLVAWSRSMAFWPIGRQIDGSWWTLGIETAFYLAIAATLALRPSQGAVAGFATVVAVISAVFWLMVVVDPTTAPLADDRTAQLLLLPHGCFFAIGMVIADVRARGWTRGSQVAAFLALMAAALEITRHAMVAEAMSGVATPPAVAVALFAAGTLLLVEGDRLQPRLRRVIAPAHARALGLMTYPLYLLHQDAGAAVTGVMVRRGLTPGAALLVSAALAIVVAWLVSHVGEPRVRTWLAGRLRPRRGPPPDTHPSASPRAG